MGRMMLVALVLSASVVVLAATTCPTVYECISSVNLSCDDDAVTKRSCSKGLTTSYSFNGTHTVCTCKESQIPTPTTPVLVGDTCTDENDYSDGYYCKKNPIGGSTELRWYSRKKIGDSCSNAYDCDPPRVCTSGKCAANLAAGSVCYNYTFSFLRDSLGVCPPTHYCPAYSSEGTPYLVSNCTARLALGAACIASSSGCVPPYECYQGFCVSPQYYFLESGSSFNDSRQCKSGQGNYTDFLNPTCVNYELLYNSAEAKKGMSCSTDTDCGAIGTYYNAECECNDQGRNNAPICSGSKLETPAEKLAEYNSDRDGEVRLYNAGCEQDPINPHGANQLATSGWCYRIAYPNGDDGDFNLATYCALARAQISLGVLDCSGFVSAICGAFQTMSVSAGVLVALMVASIFGASTL